MDNFRKEIESIARKVAREEIEKMLQEMREASIESKPKKEETYISAKQVCEKLGISLMTLTRHRNSGKVPAHRFAGRVLYKLSEVETVMTSNFNFNKP